MEAFCIHCINARSRYVHMYKHRPPRQYIPLPSVPRLPVDSSLDVPVVPALRDWLTPGAVALAEGFGLQAGHEPQVTGHLEAVPGFVGELERYNPPVGGFSGVIAVDSTYRQRRIFKGIQYLHYV